MIELTGITRLFEPAVERRVDGSSSKDAAKVPAKHDDIQFSQEAQEASSVARLVELAKDDSGVRQERIDQAKKNIEEGTHRVEDVILQVAARIVQFVET